MNLNVKFELNEINKGKNVDLEINFVLISGHKIFIPSSCPLLLNSTTKCLSIIFKDTILIILISTRELTLEISSRGKIVRVRTVFRSKDKQWHMGVEESYR